APPPMQGILLAFLGAREIKVAAQSVGNRKVGLQDAAEHFLVEFFLKRFGIPKRGVGVGVFRVEVGDDFGIVFIAEPGVVVDAAVAVDDVLDRVAPRDGGPGRADALGIGRKAGRGDVGVGVHEFGLFGARGEV